MRPNIAQGCCALFLVFFISCSNVGTPHTLSEQQIAQFLSSNNLEAIHVEHYKSSTVVAWKKGDLYGCDMLYTLNSADKNTELGGTINYNATYRIKADEYSGVFISSSDISITDLEIACIILSDKAFREKVSSMEVTFFEGTKQFISNIDRDVILVSRDPNNILSSTPPKITFYDKERL